MSVELSGWRKRQIALDQKAENARELGLDYDAAQEKEACAKLIKSAQGVLDWTEIAHRPPMRDTVEVGRTAKVRLHALADLKDALAAHVKENT